MNRVDMQDHLKKIQLRMQPLQEKARDFVETAQKQFQGEQSFIGIDVGTSAVKVVQMANLNGVMTLVKSVCVDIGGVPGNQEEVLASLKTALIGIETKGAKINAIVNCPQTCTRKIIAPHMPKKELEQAIRWEAKNAIPFSLEEALIDYEILGEITEKDVKKMIVMVAATPKETAQRVLDIFTKAGIVLDSLIPISAGQQNLIATSKEQQDQNIAVVEIGAAISELNIYQKGRLVFSRKLPIAGNDITKAMTSTLMSSEGKIELTSEEAEKIKKDVGIPEDGGTEAIDGKILPSQIVSLVRPCVEQLANEIERSFDFFREDSRGDQVHKIILFGGGANLKRLVEALRDDLGVEVAIGNALEGIQKTSEVKAPDGHVGSRFNLAIGAALNKAEKINLLPKELKNRKQRFVETLSLQVIVVVVVMTMLLSYIGLQIQSSAQKRKIKALQLEQRVLAPKLEAAKSTMTAGLILKDRPYWEDVLREISNTIQPKMYLTELHMQDDQVNIRGVITQGDQGAQAVLSNFMITLEEGIFRHVNLVMTKKGPEGTPVLNFEIEAEID